jgi:mannose-1-phosphate guanylyltransferase
MKNNRYAVIMAGGVGSRFWPVSKQSFPKQFHDMLGIGRSLLQMTFDRLEYFIPTENILILTNTDYVSLVQEQLPKIERDQIVAEPAMRNTAPCILLAALKIQKLNPDAVMIVAPSDHFIKENDVFQKNVIDAFSFCEKNTHALMTLGIPPTSPNTGYGYIEHDRDGKGVIQVKQFREKPDLKTAEQFVAAGNFLWNAGIFIWSVDGVVSAFAKAQPQLSILFSTSIPVLNTDAEKEWLEENYKIAENISVDYAIMESSDQVYVIPAEFSWNDLGTWGSLYNELSTDHGNVAIKADVLEVESTGNIISTSRHKKVVLMGIKDLIIVEQDDILVILPKKNEQAIKELRNHAMKKYGNNIG